MSENEKQPDDLLFKEYEERSKDSNPDMQVNINEAFS